MASPQTLARVAAARVAVEDAKKALRRANRRARLEPVPAHLGPAMRRAMEDLRRAELAARAEDDAHMGRDAAEAMRRRDAAKSYHASIQPSPVSADQDDEVRIWSGQDPHENSLEAPEEGLLGNLPHDA